MLGGEVDVVVVTGVKYLEAHNFGHSANGGVLELKHAVVVDRVDVEDFYVGATLRGDGNNIEVLAADDGGGELLSLLAQVLHCIVVYPALGGGHAGVTEAPHPGSQGRGGTFTCCRCS